MDINTNIMNHSAIALILSFLLWALLPACQPSSTSSQQGSASPAQPASYIFDAPSPRLDAYWYEGEAEISRYELRQNRYADLHRGEVIAIFVTEDFLLDQQVKNDYYTNPNSTPILKLNKVSRFTTGLYDYSLMTSVFTPVNTATQPQTLKVTLASQDWCGQSFSQLNFRDEQYLCRIFSYFEKEGDTTAELPYAILEDELFSRIRMNPDGLPTGSHAMLPSMAVLRLLHLPCAAVEVEASLEDYAGPDFAGQGLRAYTIEFPSLKRQLQIVFQAEAPYLIEGWTDTYPSVSDRKPRTTIARRAKTIKSAYWQQHGLEDTALREQLGLGGF
jgi:hypothetical protein